MSRIAKSGTRLLDALRRSPDPLTSLVLVVPVFVLYHLGILLLDLRNGADLVTGVVLSLLSSSLPGYVGVTLLFAGAIVIAGLALRKRGRADPFAFAPVLLESTMLALVMLVTVGWATAQLVPWQVGPRPLGPLEKLVMAAGAGFHEELVFRVGLFGGLAFVLEKRGRSRTVAVSVAAAVSAILFSLVHYLGPLGDPFRVSSFVFRTLSGLYLAAVFRLRGFAVAVYTHSIYDLLVFFVF